MAADPGPGGGAPALTRAQLADEPVTATFRAEAVGLAA